MLLTCPISAVVNGYKKMVFPFTAYASLRVISFTLKLDKIIKTNVGE